MRELAKLRALTAPERRLFLFCLAGTLLVSAGLAIFGFRRVRDAMSRWPKPREARYPAPAALARARSVARVVAIVAGRGPVRASCLRRSLLLWWILRHDGIETALRIGVSREGGAFHAHAWVEHSGLPLNDEADIARRFPPFEQNFSAPAQRAS